MGCNNGKMIKVEPASTVVVHSNTLPAKAVNTQEPVSNERFGSASSKVSNHSGDSGYEAYDDDYAGMITEDSDPSIIEKLEKELPSSNSLDFTLCGTPAPRNLSAKDKARLDEQRILEDLRNEGLIATSKFQAKSGLAFEVVEAPADQPTLRRAIPARLAKLEKKEKKSKNLTQEQIQEKLERAERRRKEKEAARLQKINSVTNKSENEVHTHIETQEQHQKELREQAEQKIDTAAEKREKRLQDLKDKQKAREERAAKVRLRKKLHIPTSEELEEIERRTREEEEMIKLAKSNVQALSQSNDFESAESTETQAEEGAENSVVALTENNNNEPQATV